MDLETPPDWNANEKTDPNITAGHASRERDGERGGGPSTLQKIGIALFAVFVFFFFLVMKLPEARIQNYIIAQIRIITQAQGFLFSAEKVGIGVFLGPALKMKNVVLTAIDNERQVLKVPYLKIKPKLLSLLSATKKVGIAAELLDGEISGTIGASPTGSIYVNLDLDSLNLSSTTILRKFLPFEARGKVSGRIQLDFNAENVQKSDGAINLKIEKLELPAQQISGFNLPKISISESKIDVTITNGRIAIREFQVGKEGSSDDLIGKISGEGTLNRMLDRSTINAKAVFTLSQGIKQSFPFIESLLASAKTPDHKYAYRITGPLTALEPVPGQ